MPKSGERPPVPTAKELDAIVREFHRYVRGTFPKLREETKWGMPWYVGTDLVFLVGAFSRHAAVEFWRGSTLAEGHPILEGTGKNLRHVKIRSLAEVQSPALRRLLRDAVRLDAREPPRRR
jgi:hypothetical protein